MNLESRFGALNEISNGYDIIQVYLAIIIQNLILGCTAFNYARVEVAVIYLSYNL